MNNYTIKSGFKIYSHIRLFYPLINYKFRMKGFTIVELLVVIALIGILSTVSFMAFNQYSRTRAVAEAANNLYAMFQFAKSRTQSQYIHPLCTTPPLNGYRIRLQATQYGLYVVCNGNEYGPIQTNVLPSNVSLTYPTSGIYTYQVVTGRLVYSPSTADSPITITGPGSNTRTITVNPDGRVSKGAGL